MVDIILPTYGRAKTHLLRFLESVDRTADLKAEVKITAVVNTKDMDTLELLGKRPDTTIVLESMEVPHLAQLMNMGYKGTTGDILMYVGDDFEFQIHGWDRRVRQLMRDTDGWALLTGPDGYLANDTCPTFFFASRKLIDIVGNFVWPYAAKEGTDLAWGLTCEPIGLLIWDEALRMEHWHSTRDLCQSDDTFKRLSAQPTPNYGKEFHRYIKESQMRIIKAHKELQCPKL